MKEANDFLGTAPIGSLLLKMSLPAVAAQLINMLYNIVDRIYIGHIAGEGALALTGVGVCLPIILIVSAFAALISMGGAPKASIAMGRDDKKAAEKILGNCFTAQIIISVVITAILLIWNKEFLMAFGASENTINYATAYMKIYAVGTVFVQLTLGMNAFITAQGFAKTGMFTVLIGAVLNIILDPIFIFVLDMGTKGAALATIISQGVSTLWVLKFLMGKKTIIHLKRVNFKVDKNILVPCMALGLAPFIMQASESIISICFNSSLLKYGGDIAVGAMTILTSVMQFALLPLNGVGQGAQPITSYNYGANNADRVRKTFKILVITCLCYAVPFWLLIELFPQVFAGIFSGDAQLVEFTGEALRIYVGFLFMMSIQTACQMTFVAIGNAKASIIVAIVRKFILLIPLIYLLPMFLENKTMAVYMAEPVADLIAVTFTIILFKKEFSKAIKK